MPTFKEDWKKAKTAFEQATAKKKPSATFLGHFNKGSGIGSALESADKAKTAGDLQKAMTSFQKAYLEYLGILDKAIADPKTTPIADKPAYAEAVKKLKAALESIHTSAGDAMQTLVDAHAKLKDKVDPQALKKFAEGEKAVKEHTAKRLALAKSLESVLAGYKSKGVETAAANAIKQAQAAKAAKNSGNTMGADIAAGASAKFAEQASKLLEEINLAWKAKSTTGEMIELRLDPAFSDVPPEKKAAYQKDAGAAWQATEKVQRDVNTYIAALRSEVLKANTAAEGAEAFRMGKVTPDTLIKRIAEMKTRLESIEGGTLGKYGGKVAGVREQQKTWAAKAAKDEKLKEGLTKQWGQLKSEHQFAIAQTAQQITEMKEIESRLKGIPTDDKAVGKAHADALAVLIRVRNTAQDYSTQGTLLVKELETYLA
ncbi:MAG: hypothetical protein SFY69_10095 [Planctomycetota bacterium]|nr:hypothetical protein [Planctomycetota bacterium]